MKNSCSMWHKWEPIPQKEPSLYTLLKSNVFLRERVGIVFENQRFKDGKISRPFGVGDRTAVFENCGEFKEEKVCPHIYPMIK